MQRLYRLHPWQTADHTLRHLVQRLGRVGVGWGLVDLLVDEGEGERRGQRCLRVSALTDEVAKAAREEMTHVELLGQPGAHAVG